MHLSVLQIELKKSNALNYPLYANAIEYIKFVTIWFKLITSKKLTTYFAV